MPISDLVPELYNAVADTKLWPELLDRVAEEIGVFGCIVFDVERSSNRRLSIPYCSGSYDPELVRYYISKFHRQEMAIQDLFESQLGSADEVELFNDAFLIGTHAERAAQSSIEWLSEIGIGHRAAGFLDKDDPCRSRFSLQIPVGDGPLDGSRLAKATALLPHIAKALELGRPTAQLAAAQQGLVAAMDRLRIGVCILDRRARIVLSNEEFRRQVAESNVFRSDRGFLSLRDPIGNRRFGELINGTNHHGHFGARPRKESIVPDGDRAITDCGICIEVAPLERSDEIGSSRLDGAIVYSLDSRVGLSPQVPALKDAFGLTGAEAELLELIGDGLTNAQIAERRERSIDTINSQVKSILSKTSCTNRTQLVRLMSNFAGGFFRIHS